MPVREKTLSTQAALRISEDKVQDHTIQLPWENFTKPKFPVGSAPQENLLIAIWKSITGTFLLPYRIWRYKQYDRAYRAQPDITPLAHTHNNTSLDKNDKSPIVAIIDSGVDYNHPAIHGSLWLNPSPTLDAHGRLDRYGWDFISGDSRAMDDGYAGTQVASLVLSVAPSAKIMPLKAINPWGITSSAAIYASFVYAVDHGAKIILCAWTTQVASKAIELGIEYAHRHHIAVVTGNTPILLPKMRAAEPRGNHGTASSIRTTAAIIAGRMAQSLASGR